jgi:hypothetical protein
MLRDVREFEEHANSEIEVRSFAHPYRMSSG